MNRCLIILAIGGVIATSAVAAPASIEPVAAPAAAAAPQAATAAPQVAQVAPPAKPKIRCRIDYEIGSLVKRTRRCGDAEMWRRADEAVRSQTQRMQDDLTGRYELPRD